MSSILSTLTPTSSPISSPTISPQATPSRIQNETPEEQEYLDEMTLTELRMHDNIEYAPPLSLITHNDNNIRDELQQQAAQDEALEEAAMEALEIFEAITEEGRRQAEQEAAAEADWDEAAQQVILEGLAEAHWEAGHQEVARRALAALAAAEEARRSTLALQEELAMGQTHDTPSFIERLDLPMDITKTELTPEGVVHYGHPTTALPVHPPLFLTNNTIMAEKDFHDAIMSLEQYAQIEGALRRIGKPGLTADICRYRALTLEIEEDCHAIERHE
ncbi:hypothetical protein EW146_g8460 [Bondarzewia mesenterica]|uniref:Uncharacterized protein n=1 Tax=Bondarzewia mesenterica TaxID=1095465 RepID=A0A4S4LE67_9AGAM|nr:hypothetical protein EW146_g8460 [Bondarzewia mesenterica]